MSFYQAITTPSMHSAGAQSIQSAGMLLECKDSATRTLFCCIPVVIAAAPTVSQHERPGRGWKGSAEKLLPVQVFLDHFHVPAQAEESVSGIHQHKTMLSWLKNRVADH